MKKLTLIICAFAIVMSAKTAELKANYFIMKSGETMTCKRILFQTNYVKVIMENGSKLIIPKEQIKVIRTNGKYYEKMPVYSNNTKTNDEIFMQFVTTRAGLKLYKYTTDISKIIDNKAFDKIDYSADCYVVYKGDQLHVNITEKNYQTLFEFFRVPYSEK
jgi:hypothetical protein